MDPLFEDYKQARKTWHSWIAVCKLSAQNGAKMHIDTKQYLHKFTEKSCGENKG